VSEELKKYVLLATSADVAGIANTITHFIYDQGANIGDAAQFYDQQDRQFFVRFEFTGAGRKLPPLDGLRTAFALVAEQFSMSWDIVDADAKPRVLIAVSKFGHCLNDLLYHWEANELPAEIVGVVSNHPDFRDKVEWYGLPYYYFPISRDTKHHQEQHPDVTHRRQRLQQRPHQ